MTSAEKEHLLRGRVRYILTNIFMKDYKRHFYHNLHHNHAKSRPENDFQTFKDDGYKAKGTSHAY